MFSILLYWIVLCARGECQEMASSARLCTVLYCVLVGGVLHCVEHGTVRCGCECGCGGVHCVEHVGVDVCVWGGGALC